MDEAGGQPHDDSAEADARLAAQEGRNAGRAGAMAALRRWGKPLSKLAAKHGAKLERWSGISGLALGVGLMAGGLEPIGFSLILLGTAVLLVDFDRRR